MLSKQHLLSIEQISETAQNGHLIRQQNNHILAIEDGVNTQQQTSWLILDKIRSGISTAAEVKDMIIVIYQWVLEQRSIQVASMGLHGPDLMLNQPLILEDFFRDIVEIPISFADTWEVSVIGRLYSSICIC